MKMNTKLLGFCLTMLLAAQPMHAQQPGWAFSAGLAVGGENVYPGSNDYYLTPLPSLSASYSRGNISCSLSVLEGLGVTYMIPKWGLIASANVNAGARRDPAGYSVLGVSVDHSASTRALLVGSRDLDAPLVLNTSLMRMTPIGLVGASVAVHRTSVGSSPTEQQGSRTGLVYALQYMASRQATERLSFSGLLSLEFMDQTYADTWHTRHQASPSSPTYEADAGLRGSVVAAEAQYWISERVSLSVLGASTILLGDARHSPFTAESVQRVMRTQVLYHF
jgi:outer membrane scaffolding protein for murein synthesis (MipA/OmpV family)